MFSLEATKTSGLLSTGGGGGGDTAAGFRCLMLLRSLFSVRLGGLFVVVACTALFFSPSLFVSGFTSKLPDVFLARMLPLFDA